MILKKDVFKDLDCGYTRTRGDDPNFLPEGNLIVKLYPHTRG